MALLEVNNLSVNYNIEGKSSQAVKNLNLSIDRGEILGIVGQSGSGKSTVAKSILRLLPPNGFISSGTILYQNTDITKCSDSDMQKIRGKEISMIFQNPGTALNPCRKIKKQFYDILGKNKTDDGTIVDMLSRVNLPNGFDIIDKYPFQLSIGMKQRVLIAMALCLEPQLIVADEPTSAIDAINRKRILEELHNIKNAADISIIVISHDIKELCNICDNILVMNKSEAVEYGEVDKICNNPIQPYTKMLLSI